jgi:hypothetical protein
MGALDALPPMLLAAEHDWRVTNGRDTISLSRSMGWSVGTQDCKESIRVRNWGQIDCLSQASFHPDRDQACDKVCSGETALTLARDEEVLCFEMEAAGPNGLFPLRGHPGHLRLFRYPQE